MPELPSGTVTFLFTDIEGSTRLLHAHGAGYAELLAEHRRVLRGAFGRHGGVEVDTQGDAFFIAFQRAGDAVAAAEEIQRAGGTIRVRIGIHTGKPTVTSEGYVGIDVHRAARICAAAHGGQVVLSEPTRTLLDGDGVRDLGMHRLKDLGAPEKLFQLGEDDFPLLRSLNATNLPAQPGPLVGRERELDELAELIQADRVVTLTGPGGSGKTRLALQAAAESIDGFVDGVLWVPLAAVSDAAIVEPTIAQAIGAEDGVAAHIDEKRMLLLLDNLEQLLPDAAPQLAELAAACPNLRLLLTSRAPLRIAGEREYAVEPLPETDAVALFRERAFVTEPEAAVQEICRRLDGLPLAIELAAARTRVLPPDQLLARLEQALPMLTGGRRDAPERQRTLRATIGWSYQLLSEEERVLFARLAVFAASFTLEAAEEVCDADLETLDSLVEKSLVRRWGSGRLGMLETIKEYALERLEESGEVDAIRRRHAESFFALAESAGLAADSELPQRHDLVVSDQANIRTALRWALETDSLLGLRLAVALENFWVTNDPVEGVRWLEALLAGAPDAPTALRARALRCLGSALAFTGDDEDVERTFEQSLALFREAGDELGAAILVFRLGATAHNSGELERARPLLEESVVTLRRLGYPKSELQALGVLGSVEWQEGNRERALELIEQSAAMAADTGFPWWRAGMLHDLARYSLELGRVGDALRWGRESLSLSRSMTDRTGTVWGLALHARIAAEQGDLERAGRLWGAVEAEEARAPLGSWYRDEYASPVLAHVGPELEGGLAEGRSLSLDEAVEYALSSVD